MCFSTFRLGLPEFDSCPKYKLLNFVAEIDCKLYGYSNISDAIDDLSIQAEILVSEPFKQASKQKEVQTSNVNGIWC